MSFNEDLGSPGLAKRIDREIMAEIGSNHSPGASNKPQISKGGQQIQYTTKERTQCIENDRFLVTKKVNVGALPDPSQK